MWHYQLMRHTTPYGEVYYAIHVEHDIEGDTMHTENPIQVVGDDEEDVVWVLKTMLKDIKKHGVKDYD